MIDDQVHFREPGFEHKGNIRTESAAAVAGGITSYMEMPNCNPLTYFRKCADRLSAPAPPAVQQQITAFIWARPTTTWRQSKAWTPA
jgi:dihydroorotase-like cyclic amidohydrolase